MYLTATRPALEKALKQHVKLAGRSPLPITARVLLTLEGDQLQLTTTSLEAALTVYLPVEGNIDGAVLVDCKQLAKILGKLNTTSITLEQEVAEVVRLTAGKASVDFDSSFPTADFPLIPRTEEVLATIEAPDLRALLEVTIPCAATDDTRPMLCAIQLTFEHDTLTASACDGYRMGINSRPAESAVDRVLLAPAVELKRLLDLLPKRGSIQLSVNETGSTIAFAGPGFRLALRAMEGVYPDLQKILQAETVGTYCLDRAALLELCSLLRSGSEQTVIELPFGTESPARTFVLYDRQVAIDYALDGLSGGDQLEMQFNAPFLAAAIQALPGPEILVTLAGAHRAVKFETPGRPGLQVVMPMHTGAR